jgi:hypothetical protein
MVPVLETRLGLICQVPFAQARDLAMQSSPMLAALFNGMPVEKETVAPKRKANQDPVTEKDRMAMKRLHFPGFPYDFQRIFTFRHCFFWVATLGGFLKIGLPPNHPF